MQQLQVVLDRTLEKNDFLSKLTKHSLTKHFRIHVYRNFFVFDMRYIKSYFAKTFVGSLHYVHIFSAFSAILFYHSKQLFLK